MNKNIDPNGRWRNITVGFRMSPSENDELNMRAKLSGLIKQDYLIKRSLEKDIIVIGSPRVYKALKNQMASILEELKRIEALGEVNDELHQTIRLIALTLGGLGEI